MRTFALFGVFLLCCAARVGSAQEVIKLTAGESAVKGADHAGYIQQPDIFGGISIHFLLFPSRLSPEQKDAIARSGSILNPESAAPGIPKSLGGIQIAFVPEARDCAPAGVRSVSIVMEKGPKFPFAASSSTINYAFSGGSSGIKAIACALGDGGGYGMDAEGGAEIRIDGRTIPIAWKVGIAGSLRLLKKK